MKDSKNQEHNLEDALFDAISQSIEDSFTKMFGINHQENVNKAIYLLNEGVNPNVKKDGWSVLQLAASTGNMEITELLLLKGADIKVKNDEGVSALYSAVRNNHLEIAELLMDHNAEVSDIDKKGNTLLHIACQSQSSSYSFIEKIISKNIDLNQTNHEGHKPITILCNYNYNFSTSENEKKALLLLERGTILSQEESEKLLAWACRKEFYNLIRVLKDKGIDMSGSIDSPSLHNAVETLNYDFLRFLLSEGANVAAVDSQGNNALHSLSESFFFNQSDKEKVKQDAKKIIALLLEHGIDLNRKNNEGITPLFLSVRNYNEIVAGILLDKNAEISPKNNEGNGLFHIAVQNCSLSFITRIAESIQDLNEINNEGQTAFDMLENRKITSNTKTEVAVFLMDKGVKATKNSLTKLLKFAIWEKNKEGIGRLISEGADSNGEEDFPSLHQAIQYGHREIVELLLSKGADIHLKDKHGNSVLHQFQYFNLQEREGLFDIFTLLVEKGADINAVNNKGVTPLENAIFHPFGFDFAEARYLLILNADVTSVIEPDNRNRLMWYLAESKLYKKIPFFLKAAKDEKEKYKFLNSCFYSAVERDDHELVKIILQEEFSIEEPCNNFTTLRFQDDKAESYPLEEAILKEREGIVTLLLENKEKIDPYIGGRALYAAIIKGMSNTVTLLVKKGADINIRDWGGKTPLYNAVIIGNTKIVKILLSFKADMSVTDMSGKTLLHIASEKGHASLIPLLVEAGIEINTPDRQGFTALQYAYIKGEIETVKNLIIHGADINALYPSGRNVLSMAAEKGNEESFFFLFEKGCNPHAEDMEGRSTIHYAVRSGNATIVNALLQKGTKLDNPDYRGIDANRYALYFDKLSSLPMCKLPELSMELYKEVHTYLKEEKEFKELSDDFDEKKIKLGEYGYKFAMLFSSLKQVKAYIEKYRNTNTTRSIHDLCLFTLPANNNFNKDVWSELALQYGPALTKHFVYAWRIEEILGRASSTLAEIENAATKIKYAHDTENPELAALFSTHGISEFLFNKMVDTHKPKEKEYLPDLYIDGRHFGEPRIYMKKLLSHDMRGYILGKFTGCCQTVGEAGGSYALHGMNSPYGGFYAVFKRPSNQTTLEKILKHIQVCQTQAEMIKPQVMKDKSQRNKYKEIITGYEKEFKENNKTHIINREESFQYVKESICKKLEKEIEGELIAQSWAWISKGDKASLVFDSWERLRPEDDRLCAPFIENAAKEVLKPKYGFYKVFLGAGGYTPQGLPFYKIKDTENPYDYFGYRGDSQEQLLINSKSIQDFLSVKEESMRLDSDEFRLILTKARALILLQKKNEEENKQQAIEENCSQNSFTYKEIKEYIEKLMEKENRSYVSKKGGFGVKALLSDLEDCFCISAGKSMSII